MAASHQLMGGGLLSEGARIGKVVGFVNVGGPVSAWQGAGRRQRRSPQFVQFNASFIPIARRRITPPASAKPPIINAQLAGSGTAPLGVIVAVKSS